jgi:cytochrome c oxidase subunit 2
MMPIALVRHAGTLFGANRFRATGFRAAGLKTGGHLLTSLASAIGAMAPALAQAAATYVPMKPMPGKGQPVPGGYTFQDQYSPIGQEALRMHDYVLLPVITAIVLMVLVLLIVVMARFNRRANPVPSRTSHNTVIEVVWTLAPVLILLAIVVPSIACLPTSTNRPPRAR